jgi:hypothetical protein
MIPALAAAALLAAAPAQAAEPTAPAAQPAQAAKPAEKDPLVCTSAKPMGSMLPIKTCVRKSERARQERDSREALQSIQRHSEGPFKTGP